MILDTERLIIRDFTEDDCNDVFEYINAQSVSCFNDMKLESKESALDLIKTRKNDINEIFLAICLKKEAKVIGEITIHNEEMWPGSPSFDTVSPCWMLHPNYQKKGYAYEALNRVFDYLFLDKNVRRIYIYTEDYNYACQHLCEKLHMRREGLFKQFVAFKKDDKGNPIYENTYQYAILSDEWNLNLKSNVSFNLAKSDDEIEEIESIAKIVWPVTYKNILSPKQIDYMVDMFLSKRSINEGIKDGYCYEIINDGDDVGFIAYCKYPDKLFLSKLYLLPKYQGKGYSSKAIAYLKGFNLPIELTVNKYNLNAYDKYIHMGFRRIDSIVSDIGNGYVMDDYVMRLDN